MSSNRSFVFAGVLCLVCSVLLTFAATSLKPFQVKNQTIDKQKNILKVLKVLDPNESYASSDIEQLYTTYIQDRWVDESGNIVTTPTEQPIFLYVKNNMIDSYAIPISGYGLWSTLYGYFAVAGDGTTVRGITFYQHGETPGLGAEVDAKWFQDNFIGKKIATDSGEFTSVGVVKGKVVNVINQSEQQYYVDGISGATVTAKGVDTFLRETLLKYEPFAKQLRNKKGKGNV